MYSGYILGLIEEMKKAYITAAAIELNGHHDTNEYDIVEEEFSNLGINPVKLVIDPLRVPWDLAVVQ